METTTTTTGCTITYTTCKYRMPCGFCELKKEQCNMIGVPYEPWKVTPVWEVTCNNEHTD